ncbi:hypothetical protein EDC64_101604 [Aquabacter spiritensis]|uniref:Uncharacterized protein n=1 Tax=Aquabacter spiritensis TaxID=933073 RepID=A0A4R3M469_9HYPH|nr:hypothetical protein EDC64_101604 [Aquabacter spiritensis]
MPVTTVVVLTAVVALFLSFAGVLLWVDHYTAPRP